MFSFEMSYVTWILVSAAFTRECTLIILRSLPSGNVSERTLRQKMRAPSAKSKKLVLAILYLLRSNDISQSTVKLKHRVSVGSVLRLEETWRYSQPIR
jgi:hypothetical protein